jgi:hypothetical protein
MATENEGTTTKIPRDEFSTATRDLGNHPEAVRKQSIVELADDYGNVTTWVITSFRVDGRETVLLQRQNQHGGDRWVLPPAVTAAISRHRDSAITVVRRRGARAGAATREARGIRPTFGKKGRA